MKRRQRIDLPHMRIAFRKTADAMGAVSIICHSPALAGIVPVNEEDKRIFFYQSAMLNLKKDSFSIIYPKSAEFLLSYASLRKPEYLSACRAPHSLLLFGKPTWE